MSTPRLLYPFQCHASAVGELSPGSIARLFPLFQSYAGEWNDSPPFGAQSPCENREVGIAYDELEEVHSEKR
jgi:hypothetical protein